MIAPVSPLHVTPAMRAALKPHRPACLWFTGLSGSGKSTLAQAVEWRLHQDFRAHTCLLDGDIVRAGLNRDLGFSLADRAENIRRAGEAARLLLEAGLIALTAFISPLRADRDRVRGRLPAGTFIEIFVDCPLAVCEQRDVKGLYRRARAGEILDFTGLSSPYEPPAEPELILSTARDRLADCVQAVVEHLQSTDILPR